MSFLMIFLGERLYFEGVEGVQQLECSCGLRVSYVQVPATWETGIQGHTYICVYIYIYACICVCLHIYLLYMCLYVPVPTGGSH